MSGCGRGLTFLLICWITILHRKGPLRLSLLGVTERRSNQPSTVVVYEVVIDVEAEQTDEQSLKILCEDSKATVAGFSYGAEWVIVGHEDGSVSRYDGKVGDYLTFCFQIEDCQEENVNMRGSCGTAMPRLNLQ